MKVFDSKQGWGTKVNFVDENDVFVGYDMGQDCCEWADWFIENSPTKWSYDFDEKNLNQPRDLDDYRFDPDYFEYGQGDLDEGGMVVFRLVSKERPDRYLHIFNCHNGYYSHGFAFGKGNEKWKEDYI